MPRRAKAKMLPAELQELLHKAIREGRLTIREITDLINAKGGDIGVNGVWSEKKKYEQLARRFSEIRVFAEGVGRELQDDPNQNVARALYANLEILLFQAQEKLASDEGGIDIKGVKEVAVAFKEAAMAFKASVDTEAKQVARVKKQAAEDMESVAAERGLTVETIDAIKAKILGIAPPRPGT